jgi:CheY-like chemotaxis protein
VLGDPTQLHQVLLNLCTNAVQAMGPTGGHLELSAQAVELDGTFCQGHPPLRPGSYVRLTVRDSGPGMDKATISRIFEPFFTTKGPGRGTGLGLAVVDGIVAGHEGAITVESSPGRGTSFVVHLPTTTATALGAPAPEPDLPRGHGENILLVDDDPLITEVGQRLLGTIGYSACVFLSPEEALHEFRCRPKDFALVITDLTMPGMNGLALAQELLSVRPEQPILLVTGFGGTTDEAAVRRAGLRGILAKPFDLRRLATEIQRCLAVKATA